MSLVFIDGHCDTLSKIVDLKTDFSNQELHINDSLFNISGLIIQFFAAFIGENESNLKTNNVKTNNVNTNKIMYDRIEKQIEAFKYKIIPNNFIHIKKFKDISNAIKVKHRAALLSIEGGDTILDVNSLKRYYNLGVRAVSLTWNYGNHLCSGIMDEEDFGLSDRGIEIVHFMNDIGMLIDVSHLSQKSFWDIARITTKPIVATHSNAKSICSHKRNLTDKQIKKIAELNGLIGINFYPLFLTGDKKATINNITNHINYIADIVGTDYIAFGSDLDGIKYLPEGITNCNCFNQIANTLKRRYNKKDVEKICFSNYLRVLKQIL